MGLDMYLRVRNKDNHALDDELMYWRKANQIRHWFVEHLENFNSGDNCEMYMVSKEVLENLVNDISTVLKDPTQANKLLPTSTGFFFGSQDYDKHYFDQLKYTLENITSILEDVDFKEEEVYYTEWW